LGTVAVSNLGPGSAPQTVWHTLIEPFSTDERRIPSRDMMQTGGQLREARIAIGLSQAKLAQLTAVPQGLLSAFERGRIELSAPHHDAIRMAMGDAERVEQLVNRKKRVVQREYLVPPRLADREALTATTPANAGYLAALADLSRAHATPKPDDAPTAVSLFSGCGGFSLGFSAAGFRLLGHLELNAHLQKIYQANFPSNARLGSDITAVSDTALSAMAQDLGGVDVIIGGPPCQGFSLSGKRDVDDPRNTLFRDYLRFVRELKPKVAVLENVRLLTSMKSPRGGLVKDEIIAAFQAEGYDTAFFEVNAKDYGVPQHRERVIFVAVHRCVGHRPSLPDRTHQGAAHRSFGDAVSDLPYLESGEHAEDPLHAAVRHPKHVIDWLWDVPQGASAHDNEDVGNRPPSGYNTTYKRQVWNEPAATVQTTSAMISGCRNVHPIATRSLTIREAARLQSFPDTYQFPSTGSARVGIGNAIPPLLAQAIARHVSGFLRGQRL